MTNPEILEFGPSGSLKRPTVEDGVPLMPPGEDAEPGAAPTTARIDANGLRMNAIAQGNKQGDMPGWMTESIDALHANIGREHGVDSREDKASPGFHDSPVTSSQTGLESVAEETPRIHIDSFSPSLGTNHFYLNIYDAIAYASGSFKTNDYFDETEENGKFLQSDYHFTFYTNFVLTGNDDIHVTGHTGEQTIGWTLFGNVEYDISKFSEWNTDAITFFYAGNSGNNTFDMTWGFFKIDLSVGGANKINVRDSIAREIIGGGGNDTIDIRGHGAQADLIDLRNGGNNTIHTEVWTNIIGGHGNDYIVSQPTFNNGNGIRADLSAGGDNTVHLLGAASYVKVGAGNDTIIVTNAWNNNGHAGNWSSARIDLSLGGANRVDVKGDSHTSGPTRAEITLGLGNSTIVTHEHTVATILGANSTGNHNITLRGSAGAQGEVYTGKGHTSIDWQGGNYDFHFGSGDLTFTARGDLQHRFFFDGSGRTADDVFVLNNWREGGEVRMGDGYTDVTHNYGIYDFHLGSGSVSMSVNGHEGFSTIYDAEGNQIVGRVDGQSPFAEAVHTFSAGEGINLHYSLQFGRGVDMVQFYAGSGNYQVTSSANRDIFQLDFNAGSTKGATYEVFDFKWGTDLIMDETGVWMHETVVSEYSLIRFQYLGETADGHAFDLIARTDVGNYEAGHVWMTVYSHDLPDLNFV